MMVSSGVVNGTAKTRVRIEDDSCAGWFSFASYDTSDREINKDLFYVNSSSCWGADPAMIYVTEGEHAGYFYIYCTTNYKNNGYGFYAWKSRNLTDWEEVGSVFLPVRSKSWGTKPVWAPAIIYDEGKYYLFYSAPWGDDSAIRYDSCAVSDSPEGPFMEITSDTKSVEEPLLIFERHTDEIPAGMVSSAVGHEGTPGFIKAIGPNPFIDPQTGKRYLFFVADLGRGTASADNTSGACCLEMEDWATPKYETLTQITRYGKIRPDSDESISEGGNTNEGPMCFYKDGKYYLIFLTYTYVNANYQTRVAVADNVMGPYTKLPMDDGAQVLYTEPNFQRQAAGIHGLTQAGDSLMGTYMTFMNNVSYQTLKRRKFAVDEIVFVENSEGVPVMYCNGPSVTPQALPEMVSGYRNMAPDAAVTAENDPDGSDIRYLTDRIIPYHDNSPAEEYEAGNGTTFTFEWEDYKTLRAVMVYNSRRLDCMFDQVDTVTLDYRKDGEAGQLTFGPVRYNWDYYDKENGKPAVGSAAIAEFDEIEVKKVTLTVSGQTDRIAIPEIILLGRDQ